MYFDIGANIGKWTMDNLQNAEKIITIEASPHTFQKLRQNISGISKIEILNYAICDNSMNPITFYHCTGADTLSTLNQEWLTSEKSRFYNYGYNEITVNTMTIDKLIEIYGTPDLIKIDVEGGEYECIKSLTQKIPLLCFEWASEMNDITYLCLDHMYSVGFTKFHLQFEDNYTYRPVNYDETIDTLKNKLQNMREKIDWGMIWCK